MWMLGIQIQSLLLVQQALYPGAIVPAPTRTFPSQPQSCVHRTLLASLVEEETKAERHPLALGHLGTDSLP